MYHNIAGIRVTYHYCSLRGLDHQTPERNGIPNTSQKRNELYKALPQYHVHIIDMVYT